MAVVAITRIKVDSNEYIEVGDELKGFSDDELQFLVENGSAVETTKNKKWTSPYVPTSFSPTVADEDTEKRDALLAAQLSSGGEVNPAAADASGVSSVQAKVRAEADK